MEPTTQDFSHFQDFFGDIIRIKMFTPICLCYAMQEQDEPLKSQVVNTLNRGLEQLAIDFPWLAGQVSGEEGTALPKILPGERKCTLVVKDLCDDGSFPSMDVLREAKFPFSMLDGNLLTPTDNVPTNWTDPTPVPVFIVQATFIKGGLLLTMIGEHTSMDGAGLARVMYMLSRACHGEAATEEQLLHGNSARTNAILSLEQSVFESYPRLDHMLANPGASFSAGHVQQGNWAYFHFSAPSLAKLKKEAALPTPRPDDPKKSSYITTNDAATAFIWKKVSQARAPLLPSGTSCMFVRAVDARSALGISPYYLGNMIHNTYTRLLASSAESTPLSVLAASLRAELKPEKLATELRAIATLVRTAPDKSCITYGADLNLLTDIWFSSWAKLDCYHLDFNLGLGLPEAVRKPNAFGAEGQGYFMPMDRDGGITAAMCLGKETTEILKQDHELREYAEWIG